MIFWGFVVWFVGAVAALMTLLVNAHSLIDGLTNFGFNYFTLFADPKFLFTPAKIIFAVGLLMVAVGLIVFFVGRAQYRRTGEVSKVGAGAIKYWRDTKGEYKKITWPTFKAVVNNTGITLALCALVGAFIVAVDFGLSGLIELLLSLK